jgi:multiple sugar transport system permease protein
VATTDQPIAAPAIVVDSPVAGSRRRRGPRDPIKNFTVTFAMVALTAAFLSPLVQAFTVSIKTPEQLSQPKAPIWPAVPVKFEYEGEEYDVYQVPIDGTIHELALYDPGRQQSTFIDPADPTAPPIVWDGSWRSLEPAWEFAPHFENYAEVWRILDIPKVMFNTIAIALIGTVGTLVSCTLVAYGFARFRFPGRNALFVALIATIFLPGAVTVIPT